MIVLCVSFLLFQYVDKKAALRALLAPCTCLDEDGPIFFICSRKTWSPSCYPRASLNARARCVCVLACVCVGVDVCGCVTCVCMCACMCAYATDCVPLTLLFLRSLSLKPIAHHAFCGILIAYFSYSCVVMISVAYLHVCVCARELVSRVILSAMEPST